MKMNHSILFLLTCKTHILSIMLTWLFYLVNIYTTYEEVSLQPSFLKIISYKTLICPTRILILGVFRARISPDVRKCHAPSSSHHNAAFEGHWNGTQGCLTHSQSIGHPSSLGSLNINTILCISGSCPSIAPSLYILNHLHVSNCTVISVKSTWILSKSAPLGFTMFFFQSLYLPFLYSPMFRWKKKTHTMCLFGTLIWFGNLPLI